MNKLTIPKLKFEDLKNSVFDLDHYIPGRTNEPKGIPTKVRFKKKNGQYVEKTVEFLGTVRPRDFKNIKVIRHCDLEVGAKFLKYAYKKRLQERKAKLDLYMIDL